MKRKYCIKKTVPKKIPVFFCAILALIALLHVQSCDMLNKPLKGFLVEYTSGVEISSNDFEKKFPIDNEGYISIPSTYEGHLHFYMRNPQKYALTPQIDFIDGVISNPDISSEYKLTQIDNTTLELQFNNVFLELNDESGVRLNPAISVYEPKSGRTFGPYIPKLRVNSEPESVANALVMKDTSTGNPTSGTYVLCFNMPNMSTIHKDIVSIKINGIAYAVTLSATPSDTETGLLSAPFYADSSGMNLEPAILGGETFDESNLRAVFYATGTDNTVPASFSIQLIDQKGLVSHIVTVSNDSIYVDFHANGGSGSMSSQAFKPSVPQALKPNEFTKSGFTFAGWNTQPNGSGTAYTNGQSITITAATTLYAQWNVMPSFLVGTAADLEQIAALINAGNDFSGVTITLTSNIDLTSSSFSGIATGEVNVFNGTFDGAGYSIGNLNINASGTNFVGFIGKTGSSSVVKNLTIASGIVNGTQKVAGLVAENHGTISNCVNNAAISGSGNYVGGVAGYNENGTVENCYNTGTVVGADYVGGIAGRSDYGIIKNCYNTANITATGEAGGIAGSSGVTGGIAIQNCYNTGAIKGAGGGFYGVGGIAGNIWSGSVINCVSLGQKVIGTADGLNVNRIAGRSGGSLSNNQAWGGTLVGKNGSEVTISTGTAANENGAALYYNGTTLSAQFGTIFANDAAWVYTNNGLPTLKNASGTQSNILPAHMWTSGDFTPESYDSTVNFTTSTKEQLENIAQFVKSGKDFDGKTITLTGNIDLTGSSFEPIGTNTTPFKGTFDGGNNTVTVKGGSSDGNICYLFNYSAGTIKNVVLTSIPLTGNTYSNAGVVYTNEAGGIIQNCQVKIDFTGKGTGDYGGIASVNKGFIENCIFEGLIDIDWGPGGAWGGEYLFIGGITGVNDGEIKNCYVYGNVYSRAAYESYPSINGVPGAIAGRSYKMTSKISNSYWTQNNVKKGSTTFDVIAYKNGSFNYMTGGTVTGCGSVTANTTITAGDVNNSGSAQTLSYGANLLNALNAYVTANPDKGLKTWSTGSGGYPVLY